MTALFQRTAMVLSALVFSILASVMIPSSARAAGVPRFAGVFSDHAVVQRDAPIQVWGTAAAGASLKVTLASVSTQVTADSNGRWAGQLPTLSAGGPYSLSVSDGTQTTTLNDILVGDVYLCSGQSNMEYPVKWSTNAWGGTRMPAEPNIRFINIQQASSVTPLSELAQPAVWQVAGPQTTGEASAVCYYMSKSISTSENVPVGMIDSYWGGTVIEAWISETGLRSLKTHDAGLDALKVYTTAPDTARATWAAVTREAWKQSEDDIEAKLVWADPKFRDTDWKTIVPDTLWEVSPDPDLATFDGIVWYRTVVNVTRAQAKQAARLTLGPVDDGDVTWVNGALIGTTYGWDTPRDYELPAGTLKTGRNTIVVRVTDTGGGGGLYGKAADKALRFADGTSVTLPNVWRYRISGPVKPGAANTSAPWATPNGLTNLYNAMIAPVAPYTLKGVAWYQGESNAGAPVQYQDLLSAWMADWRRAFRQPTLPFLVVQLANYGPVATKPVNSSWARLRESQRLAVAADPHAALAVSVDFGDRSDIHPTQKTVIGNRLARAARSVIYGKPVTPGGPEPISVSRSGDDLIVRFKNVNGGLVAYSSANAIGFEVCSDETCTYAMATPDGDSVILQGANRIGMTKVRYAWADSPYVNLYSKDDLPAVPFEMEINP